MTILKKFRDFWKSFVPVEEQIGHNLPWKITRDDATETQNLTGQEPPHQTNRLVSLIVARDRDVNELGRRVNIAKSNNWDVGVRGLGDGLVIGTGIGDDQETRFTETSLDLISERT